MTEIVGKHHRVLCFADYAASDDYDQFWKRLRAGRFEQGVYLRRRNDGSELWLQATYNPIVRDGRIHRILKTAANVAHQVRLEREVRRGMELETTLEDLGAVVKKISGIAVQTNLLSLNATIERRGQGARPRLRGSRE